MTFRLADHGHAFSTRPRGVELLALLDRSVRDGEVVQIDFTDVLSVSYSFADEFIGRLFERQAHGTARYGAEITHVPDALCRVIEHSLASRGMSAAACGWRIPA